MVVTDDYISHVTAALPPSLPPDNIRVMVNVWRLRRNISELLCAGLCDTMFTAAHLYEQFLQVQQIGFVTFWNPYAMRRGSYLELYYCNMVEWFW